MLKEDTSKRQQSQHTRERQRVGAGVKVREAEVLDAAGWNWSRGGGEPKQRKGGVWRATERGGEEREGKEEREEKAEKSRQRKAHGRRGN